MQPTFKEESAYFVNTKYPSVPLSPLVRPGPESFLNKVFVDIKMYDITCPKEALLEWKTRFGPKKPGVLT